MGIFSKLFNGNEPDSGQLRALIDKLDTKIEKLRIELESLEARIPALLVGSESLDGGSNERLRAGRVRRDIEEIQRVRQQAVEALARAEKRERQAERDRVWEAAQRQARLVREAAEHLQRTVEVLFENDKTLREFAYDFVRRLPEASPREKTALLADLQSYAWARSALQFLRDPTSREQLERFRRHDVRVAANQWLANGLARRPATTDEGGNHDVRRTHESATANR